MKKTTKKLLLALSLAAVLSVGGTLAYFTDTDETSNMTTIGHVDGSLEERTNENNVEQTEDGITYLDKIVPGDVISKEPYIVLDGESQSAYARVSITVELDNEKKLTKEQSDNKALINENLELLKDYLDINNAEGWYKGNDNYYYYNQILNPGDTSKNIFTKVTIPGAQWDNLMVNLGIKIKIKGELIQSDNFTPQLEDGHIVSWGNDITKKIKEYKK